MVDDREIIDSVLQGNTRAYANLVFYYKDKLQKVIVRFVHNEEDAEDIVQEAFSKAYTSLATFRNDCAFFTWLYRIAVNLAKNKLEANKRQPQCVCNNSEEDEEEEQDIGEATESTPETILESKQSLQQVAKVLDSLHYDMAITFELFTFHNQSYENIAQFMGCPIGTVRSRISRVRELISSEVL